MNLTDQELTLYALREAQLIIADHDQSGPRDREKTLEDLRDLLNREDVIEAVDRLKAQAGLRHA